MKTTSIIRHLVWVLFAMTLLACSDHRIPADTPGLSNARLRVKTLTHVSGLSDRQANNVVKVSSFQYDAQGRLSSIVAYQLLDSSSGPVERNTYQYDAQNRLILHQRKITRPSFYTGTMEQHQITYNSDGQAATIKYFNDTDSPGTLALGFTSSSQFTTANRLQSNQKILNPAFVLSGGGGVQQRADKLLSNIIFDGDNLASFHLQAIYNDFGSAISITDSDYKFTYDDQVNPFYGLYIIPVPTGLIIDIRNRNYDARTYYGGLDNWQNLSRNNVLKYETYNASAFTYQYTYNAAHLPTSRTIITDYGLTVEKINYEYESY